MQIRNPDPATNFSPDLDPPMLQKWPSKASTFSPDADPDPTFLFDADADPDPAFHFAADAHPDPAYQNDMDTCGSGSPTLAYVFR
jgi:hypothetical protein